MHDFTASTMARAGKAPGLNVWCPSVVSGRIERWETMVPPNPPGSGSGDKGAPAPQQPLMTVHGLDVITELDGNMLLDFKMAEMNLHVEPKRCAPSSTPPPSSSAPQT